MKSTNQGFQPTFNEIKHVLYEIILMQSQNLYSDNLRNYTIFGLTCNINGLQLKQVEVNE